MTKCALCLQIVGNKVVCSRYKLFTNAILTSKLKQRYESNVLFLIFLTVNKLNFASKF